MKKNKGFTLVEITAVVVVLSIIALLITPIVSKLINTNRDRAFEDQKQGIIASAKAWGAEHVGQLPGIGDSAVTVTLSTLQSGGYASNDLKNPKTNELFDSEDVGVIITNNNGILIYEFKENLNE